MGDAANRMREEMTRSLEFWGVGLMKERCMMGLSWNENMVFLPDEGLMLD